MQQIVKLVPLLWRLVYDYDKSNENSTFSTYLFLEKSYDCWWSMCHFIIAEKEKFAYDSTVLFMK